MGRRLLRGVALRITGRGNNVAMRGAAVSGRRAGSQIRTTIIGLLTAGAVFFGVGTSLAAASTVSLINNGDGTQTLKYTGGPGELNCLDINQDATYPQQVSLDEAGS